MRLMSIAPRSASVAPLRRGDVVELRPPEAILATLDGDGALDGLPFMPEMLGYFGDSYSVAARVERACDTIDSYLARRMPDTVLLDDLRCDGAGHGGCQAACRLYWKEAWLRRIRSSSDAAPVPTDDALRPLRDLALRNARRSQSGVESRPTYRCQATEFVRASERLGWWDAKSFLREVSSRNVSLGTFVRVMTRLALDESQRRLGLKSSRPFAPSSESSEFSEPRGLKPGDTVRVRPADEIARTLDGDGKLRGLWFDREMLPYCGTTARVKTQVKRFVDERSGEMVELKSDCYILEGVVCKGCISEGRWFCCRAIYPWWREAWLEPEGEGVQQH
jgi:hypothetical protein